MNDKPEVENKNNDRKIRLGLISGGLLLATGTLLAAGAKMRGKIDLSGMRQRVQPGKWLPFKSKEEVSSIADTEEQEPETSSSAEEIENTPEVLGE